MKRIYFLICLSCVLFTTIYSQKHKSQLIRNYDCELYPALLDSIYSYDIEDTSGQWIPVAIRLYESSYGNYDRLIFIDPNNRRPIRASDFEYDINGNLILETMSYFSDNGWIAYLKKESSFDADNNKLSELRSSWKNGEWVFNTYYYFEYSGDKIFRIYSQLKDSSGFLYDQTYNEYIYKNDKLSEVKVINAQDGSLKEVDRYYYKDNLLTEYIILIPTEDNTHIDNLVTFRRRLYFYDEFSLLRKTIFEEMHEGKWNLFSKYEYFYKLDNKSKISVCHNGHTICLPYPALKAHINHGDNLGECAYEQMEYSKKNGQDYDLKKMAPLILYPNPAKDYLTIKLNDPECSEIYRIDILDIYGMPVKSYIINGQDEISFSRGNLVNGQYLIRAYGDEIFTTTVIFK